MSRIIPQAPRTHEEGRDLGGRPRGGSIGGWGGGGVATGGLTRFISDECCATGLSRLFISRQSCARALVCVCACDVCSCAMFVGPLRPCGCVCVRRVLVCDVRGPSATVWVCVRATCARVRCSWALCDRVGVCACDVCSCAMFVGPLRPCGCVPGGIHTPAAVHVPHVVIRPGAFGRGIDPQKDTRARTHTWGRRRPLRTQMQREYEWARQVPAPTHTLGPAKQEQNKKGGGKKTPQELQSLRVSVCWTEMRE